MAENGFAFFQGNTITVDCQKGLVMARNEVKIDGNDFELDGVRRPFADQLHHYFQMKKKKKITGET